MKGSKYLDEDIEKALALLASGVSIPKVSKLMGVPRNTVWYWQHKAKAFDDDFIAEREKQKALLASKCWNVGSKSIDVLDKRISNVKKNSDNIDLIVNSINESNLELPLKEHLIAIYRKNNSMTVNELLKASKEMLTIYENLTLENIANTSDNIESPIVLIPDIVEFNEALDE